ncbi:prenyltransferase alpha subunit repeat protein [Blastocladiella britannica]|nr:prenyltransferase alpha subunit repeat protein [Blastocladiella britannica]
MTTAIPYASRPEWTDLSPVSVSEGPAPFAPILFSDEYKDAIGYFLACVAANERSERVMALTAHLIDLNPALYDVWRHRQLTLIELRSDLRVELRFVSDLILDSPKNYQLWQHREFIVERLNDGTDELKFVDTIFESDPKNYHAWYYRQWVVIRFSLWDTELDLTDKLIVQDVRNNSAWTYRYFLLFGSSKDVPGRDIDVDMPMELDYVMSAIRRAPSNESPWVYLRGILRHTKTAAPEAVMAFCGGLVAGQCMSAHLYTFLADEYESVGQLELARGCMEHLSAVVDKTRTKYWQFRLHQIAGKPDTAAKKSTD